MSQAQEVTLEPFPLLSDLIRLLIGVTQTSHHFNN